jgi:DNA-binding YbaB/EbfC family protein
LSQSDLSVLLQQAQALQGKLKQMQEEAAAKLVVGNSGGGMVKATVDGSMRVRRIEIDPLLLASNDRPMLEDLIVVAINDALNQAQNMMAEAMGKAAGLPPGFKLPGMGGD